MNSNWAERRVGDFSTRKKVINEVGEDLPPLSVTKDRGVLLQSEKYKKRVATDPHKYVVVEDGDFAFDPMSLYYGALGRVGGVGRGLISPDYVAFIVDSTVDPVFLEYKLRSVEMIRVYETVAQAGNQFGKRRRVYWSVLADLPVLMPPLPEQRVIAATLKAVDAAIAAGEAVVGQLDAVRRDLAEDLLRRGLPGGRLEAERATDAAQAGVGKVPAGWRVVRLGEVLDRIDAGWSPDCETRPATADEWGVLKVSAVSSGRFRPEENKALPVSESPRPLLEVRLGDVIVARASGAVDLVGVASIVRDARPRLMLSDKTLRLVPRRDVLDPDYLWLLLGWSSVRSQILEAATGSHMRNISQAALKTLWVAIPDLEQQRAIASALRACADRVEAERAHLEQLRCVRAALADALLSGRLRVREAA